ncbi:hypothetical protein [Nocardioides zeicaulis]
MTTWVLVPALLVVVARQAAVAMSDPDSFWHLRLGDLLLQQGSLSTPDWDTQDHRHWVLTQWLPELASAKVEAWFGLPGVMWLFGASLVALTLVVHGTARAHAGTLASGFATALGLVAMSGSLSPRPHMLTYVFLAITVGVWLAVERADQLPRPPWLLVPLTWVWAMCHGMWFTGPLVGVAVCIGLALDRRAERRVLGRMLAVPLLSVVVAALTPVGPSLLLAPVEVGGIGRYITEWQAPSFRTVGPAAGALLIVLVAGTWSRARERTPWTQILLLALAAGWTVLAARTVTLGAIIAVPLAAAVIQRWLDRPADARTRAEWTVIAGTTLATLSVLALVVPHTSSEPGGVPDGLSPQLAALPPGTAVLNDYAVGGWLRWSHPDLDPLVDGLTEAYSIDELEDYGKMTTASRGWEDLVDETGAEVALLPKDSPLAVALEQTMGWCVAGIDADYAVVQAPTTAGGTGCRST